MDYTEDIARHFSRHSHRAFYYRLNQDSVKETLMLFRQNGGYWLPEPMDEHDRKAYADALFWYLGHRPRIRYDDEEEKYFISYE